MIEEERGRQVKLQLQVRMYSILHTTIREGTQCSCSLFAVLHICSMQVPKDQLMYQSIHSSLHLVMNLKEQSWSLVHQREISGWSKTSLWVGEQNADSCSQDSLLGTGNFQTSCTQSSIFVVEAHSRNNYVSKVYYKILMCNCNSHFSHHKCTHWFYESILM